MCSRAPDIEQLGHSGSSNDGYGKELLTQADDRIRPSLVEQCRAQLALELDTPC